MATQRLTLTNSWAAAARITAAGNTAILARNTDNQPCFWAITADNTAPTFGVMLGHQIEPNEEKAFILADTERLWFATRDDSGATITVTSGTNI